MTIAPISRLPRRGCRPGRARREIEMKMIVVDETISAHLA